jgi:hypothetical protein
VAVLLDAATLRAALSASAGCAHCARLRGSAWESVSEPLAAPAYELLGSLRDASLDEPTLEERHADTPEGRTHYWHPRAPLALHHYPCNRCTAWRCPSCQRGFVQYTEAGGYYLDHRVRAIDPALIED